MSPTRPALLSILVILLAVRLFGDDPPLPVVKSVQSDTTKPRDEFRLRDTISITMDGLPAWVSKGGDLSKLRLFLDNRIIQNLQPIVHNPGEGVVAFELSIRNDDRDTWTPVLTAARYRNISVSVGLVDKKTPFPSDVKAAKLEPGPDPIWFAVALVAGLLIILWLGKQSNLLRNSMAGVPVAPAKPPFSLGKLQIALWSVLVFVAYVYIFLITGSLYAMNSQVLVLLGISAGASVGAAAADSYKLTSSPPAPPQAQHFFQELVSDSNGIAIDRSQFVIWTLTLAAVFVYLVWRDLAMPTFDNTVVALMGISSGAYVGLKLPK